MGKQIQNSLALLITAQTASFNKKMDELSSKTDQIAKKSSFGFSSIGSALGKIVPVLGVAKLAQMGFNEALKANDDLADAFDVKMTQAKTAVSSFFSTLTTGDWDNFKSNMEESIRLAKEYKEEMQFLEDVKVAEKVVGSQKAAEIAELKVQARYGDTVKKREWATNRLKALYDEDVNRKKQVYEQEYDAYAKKIAAEHNLDVNYVKNALSQYLTLYDLIGADKMREEQEKANKILNTPSSAQKYLTPTQSILASSSDLFRAGSEEVDKLAQSLDNIEKLEKQRYDDLREIEKFERSITKESDKQLNNKKEGSTIKAATMDAQYNLVSDAAEMRKIGPSSKQTSPIDNPLPSIDFDSYISGSQAVVAQNKQMSESFNTMENDSMFLESAFATLGSTIVNSFSQGEAGVESFVSTLLGSLQSVLVAELSKALAATISGSMQTGKNPILGLALATASVAGVKALWDSSIPKYGNGGLVTSPTLAIVGEKGPERITPVGRGGSSTGVVELRLKGKDAVALVDLNKYYEQLA